MNTSTPSATSAVTVVGIGAIGLPMARRIAQAGFAVTGVDPFPGPREAAEAAGIPAEETAASAASADAVVCMVATPDQLREAALSEGGLLKTMPAGSALIIMSTVGISPVEEVAEGAAQAGIAVLDVPVTGGVARARTGELNLFASGPSAVIEAHRPMLESMGRIIGCGEIVGRGQAMKAVNQLLCSVHLAAAGEALAFAETLGLDPSDAFEAVSGGAGGSWMLSDRGPRMLEGIQGIDPEVTSTIGIFVKDSSLVADLAEEVGFDAPLVAAARERFRLAADAGNARRDDSQVIQTYRG